MVLKEEIEYVKTFPRTWSIVAESRVERTGLSECVGALLGEALEPITLGELESKHIRHCIYVWLRRDITLIKTEFIYNIIRVHI